MFRVDEKTYSLVNFLPHFVHFLEPWFFFKKEVDFLHMLNCNIMDTLDCVHILPLSFAPFENNDKAAVVSLEVLRCQAKSRCHTKIVQLIEELFLTTTALYCFSAE